MNKKYIRFFSFIFLIIGIIILLLSGTTISGAFIGISNISFKFDSFFGIILILFSLILFIGGTTKENFFPEETLENIISGNISNTKERSIAYLGKQIIKKGKKMLNI